MNTGVVEKSPLFPSDENISKFLYVEVAVFREIGSVTGVLTYTVPPRFFADVEVGKLVEIPLRGHREKGIICAIHSKNPNFSTQEIGNISAGIVLSPVFIQMAQKFSMQNFCSHARAIKLFLPHRLLETNGEIPQKEGYILLNSPQSFKKMGKKQQEALSLFSAPGEILEISTFTDRNISRVLLRKLEKKGILGKKMLEMYSSHTVPSVSSSSSSRFQKIFVGSSHSSRNVAVLEAMQEAFQAQKQIIFLLPDHFSLLQRFQKFSDIFGEKNVSILSSLSTEVAKYNFWWDTQMKTPHIFLGTKSTLFFPYKNLGLIVVEDVQDQSYKNDGIPRFHARETSELLAECTGASLLFSTACPDSETLGNRIIPLSSLSSPKKWTLTTFSSVLPFTAVYDMKNEISGGNTSSLALPVQHAISETLQNGHQVIIFLNRRGMFRAVFCTLCGYVEKCPFCNISLPVHQKNGISQFFCQWCGYTKPLSQTCAQCGSDAQKEVGEGTQRTEEDLQKMFPQARIIRADRDSVTGKYSTEDVFGGFQEGKYDILIGTQMVTKSFDFLNVGLVVSIFPEISLYSASFRSAEKMFQNLVNLKDRLGKKVENKKFLIQTHIPTHPAFSFVLQDDVLGYISSSLLERKKLFLPPFSRMIRCTFVGTDFQKVQNIAKKSQKKLQEKFKKSSIILSSAVVPYRKGEFFVTLTLVISPHERILPEDIPKSSILDPYGDEM